MPRVKQIASLVLLVVIACVVAACNRAGSSGSTDTAVAATVNGQNIYLREVDAILNQQAKRQQSDISKMSPLELASGRLQVLDDLIRQEVLYQRAEKENLLPKDEEVTQAIETQKQQASMTQDEFQNMLKETGQTEQDLRNVARKQLAIKNLLDRMGSKVGTPSEKEVADFYNNNRDVYVTARGVGLAAIVADPNENPGITNDSKSEIEAKNKIDILYQRLKSGADFATVAREQSEDQSLINGGDIGFAGEAELKKAGFPPEIIANLFGPMQTGDITPPVKGSDGRWSIFKLTAKRLQTENLTLDNPEVKKDITDKILDQRKQLMTSALVTVAMNEARVENKLAQDTMNNAAALSSLRPAGAATPAPAATPATSPSATASPAASASPAAKPTVKPTVKPTPAATPVKPATAGNSNK
ncbi:MAG: SurA N-terminal domain-containing protein [Pyrinomonadaceae bacterium]